jgi:hypothetical protein
MIACSKNERWGQNGINVSLFSTPQAWRIALAEAKNGICFGTAIEVRFVGTEGRNSRPSNDEFEGETCS